MLLCNAAAASEHVPALHGALGGSECHVSPVSRWAHAVCQRKSCLGWDVVIFGALQSVLYEQVTLTNL